MSLIELLESNRKEIPGSRTKNRLTVQISYAIQLIMDFYSADYIVLMDYIEDVSVICDPDEPTEQRRQKGITIQGFKCFSKQPWFVPYTVMGQSMLTFSPLPKRGEKGSASAIYMK